MVILYFCLLGSLLTAQQATYTSVPNIKDTFDYGSFIVRFNNKIYELITLSSPSPFKTYFSQVNILGNVSYGFDVLPKLNPQYDKAIFFGTQIGSKLFLAGREDDTITTRGSLTIVNSDLTVFKDTVFFDYLAMEMNMCRYDKMRNKVIALFSYIPNKDSLYSRYWGVMEFDTFGNLLRKKEMTPIAKYDYADNLLVTSDGNYLVSGKLNGINTNTNPFFVKLDTNLNVVWRNDLRSTGKNFFTQDYSENLVELPNGKGYCYVGEIKGGKHDNCNFFDSYTSLHFISQSGLVTNNYYHNLINKNCEGSRPKGLFLKNDSTLMIFTQRDTTSDGVITGKDSASSLVVYYNFNQHRAVKEIIGGQLLNDKTPWVVQGDNGICYRLHVGRDIDGGYITSGWAHINDNFGNSAYLMKTDSCGYTQDHKCKLVYKIDTLYGNTLKVHIIDSLSVLCQPIWTIEGKQYTSLDIIHNFSTTGIHTVKLWGFAGSTVDSLSFQVQIDSMNSRVLSANDKHIMIYPNPAREYLYVTSSIGADRHLSLGEAGRGLTLTNLLGQQISPKIESIPRGYRLDIRDLPVGMYILQIKDDGGEQIITKRILISR